MPKFSLDINGIDQDAALGREAWAGEVPPTGTYKGILKVVQIKKISDNAEVAANRGKPKLNIGVELVDAGKYSGYVAWNNLNLVDSSIPYINQFLIGLTDGSDAQFKAIKTAFYPPNGFVTDDRQQHVTAIGKWKIESPDGTIPVLVSCRKRGYIPNGSNETTYVTDIASFLVGAGGAKNTGGVTTTTVETVPEEEAEVALEDEDVTDDGGVFGEEEEVAEEVADA